MRLARNSILDDPYPASDGKPMAETQVHVALMASRYEMLRLWLKPRGIYVAANMFLYYKEGDVKARKAPDIMAVKGVDVEVKRRSFKAWEEKAVPCCIVELTSKKTAKEDQNEKKELYRKLRVREYFLFGERVLTLDELREQREILEERLEALQERNKFLEKELSAARRRAWEAQKNLEEVQRRAEEAQKTALEQQRRAEQSQSVIDEQARQLADMAAELARLKAAQKGKSS